MGYTIKKIKGRQYLYMKQDGRTIYVGPLDEVVKIYLLYRKTGSIPSLSKRDLKRLFGQVMRELCNNYSKVKNNEEKKNLINKPDEVLVRRPGFEPGISGLAGRRPSPG